MRLSGLRYKVLLVVAAGLLLLFAVQFVVGRLVLLEGYSQLEQDKMLTKVGSAVSLLEEQSRQLDSITVDWAHWDDSYQYMAVPNQECIDSNYTDDTFDNLNISAILLVDADGNILFKKGVVAGEPWPIPLKLELAASKGGALIDTTDGRNHVSGFFWTPEGVFIVAAFDVRPSGSAEGERRGTLIMVRQLDHALLDHVSQLLGIDIIVERADARGLAADRLDALRHMQAEGGMAVKPLSDTDMVGYALMEDVGDTTPLLMRATDDRRIFEQGQSSLNFLIGSTALIVLVLGVFHWLFDRLVLVRLAHLSESVNRIGESADTVIRIPTLRGKDELAGLSHGINGMLERLGESQRALHYEKERAQITLAGIADAVITSDAAGAVDFLKIDGMFVKAIDNNPLDRVMVASISQVGNVMKIDRSFVRDLARDESDRAIAETIVIMAKRLGMKTIAEGVETVEQRNILAAVNCEYVQGYLYSRPLPAAAFLKYATEGMPKKNRKHLSGA